MDELPGWFFCGLNDSSGSPVSGDPLARLKGERWRDLGFLMNTRGYNIDVSWGNNGEQMWNGMLRGQKAEAMAKAQLDRANASGADQMITLFIPNTVLESMHWSWMASYTNSVVREWLYAQTNPDPVGTANIVAPGTETYAVTINSVGTGAAGGGNYQLGARVSISAGTPPAGLEFVNWVATGGVIFDNPNNVSTRFTMPAFAVTVTAIFRPIASAGPAASVSAPSFYGAGGKLSYTISLENELVGINGFIVKFEFDPSVLLFAGSEPLFPGYSPVIESVEDGLYSAMFMKGAAGSVDTAVDIKPILRLNFDVIAGGKDITGTLVSMRVMEMPSNESVECILYPAQAASEYMFFDANGDGVFDERDLSYIIYYYYMVSEGDPLWGVAKGFDAYKDNRIDMLDILIIAAYLRI